MQKDNAGLVAERRSSMNIDEMINAAKEQQAKVEHKNRYDENLQSLPINDKIHLYNHLNYLFRTDAGQKWTNELTDSNTYMFYLPSHEKFNFEYVRSLEERTEFKKAMLQRIKTIAEEKGKTIDRYAKKLSQLRVDYLDNAVFSITDAVKKDTVELLANIKESYSGFTPVCSVIHTDQKENHVHLHVLYLMD